MSLVNELINRLARYTNISGNTIKEIMRILTFGEAGINNPDIMIQPIIDMKDGNYALSPFVFSNSNPERNFCVLLNQVEEEKRIYSVLSTEKEKILKDQLRERAEKLGFNVVHGELNNGETIIGDLDFVIIDHKNKCCICLELKWFIPPAEIREVIDRTKELKKGVDQAKKILNLFKENELFLMHDLLGIDQSYLFTVAVGSHEWIGNFDVQDEIVPIINIWHLFNELEKTKNLAYIIKWLTSRDYLPKSQIDFEVKEEEFKVGKWSSSWYGFKIKNNGQDFQ